MKKVLLVALLAGASMIGYAKGDLDNQFYFRGGLCRPTWHYGFGEGKSDFEDSKGDTPKRTGFAFELGNIFMLNSLPLADGLRLGINADYLSVYNAKFVQDGYKSNTFFLGSKLGPSLTYSPVSNLELDVFAKIHPVWFALGTDTNSDYSFGEAMSDGNFSASAVKIKYSLGFNVRYAIAMIGFDFCPGKMKTYSYEDGEKSEEPIQDEDGNNLRYNTFNLTVGLSF